jgi:hypothetical protein
MGISLYGLTPATTYDALIKTGDNEPLTASLKVLSDGVGTNLPMEASTTGINFTGLLLQGGVAVPTAAQVAAKQDTLVSGTNIKTINGTTVLGSGNIVTPSTPPSGVSGAIQFSNGSAFASDATNFFWDNTNKRLGIGTNAPTEALQIVGTDNTNLLNLTAVTGKLRIKPYFNSTYGTLIEATTLSGSAYIPLSFSASKFLLLDSNVGIGLTNPTAKTQIQGSGSTSATTSLLVQNSAGTQSLKIDDSLGFQLGSNAASGSGLGIRTDNGGGGISGGINTNFNNGATWIDDTNTRAIQIPYNGGVLFANTTRYPITIGAATKAVASAQLEMVSTTQGFLPPRMTTAQKNAIASPAAGLVLYDSTTNKLQCYNGSTWNDLF